MQTSFFTRHSPLATRHWIWLLLTVGCQPAVRYEKPAAPGPPAAAAKSDEAGPGGLAQPSAAGSSPDTPIVFVAEKDGEAWARLPKFWNPPPTAEEKAAAALALFPGTAAPLAALEDAVRIKVPAGLDDPHPFLPSDPDSNPPTLSKWRLGRRLFYDPTWLTDEGGRSCASCHQPRSGFADDARDHGDFNTPTLVNCVYNRRQFWDGRVGSLEEVVQHTVADETAPEEKLPFHVWGGVVRRLRASAEYQRRFPEVFGNEPTQDAVGKALATYLRTLLAADSVYDRAVAAQKAENAAELKAEHTKRRLTTLPSSSWASIRRRRARRRKKIYRGYRLFYDLEERKTGCAACHGGGEFTDGEFHNLGVGFAAPEPGHEPGRFASLPLGRKDAFMIGAYKTPTLRGLPRTGPYFHDGSAATLEDAVQFHIDGGRWNQYIAPQTADARLPGPDREALLLFLRAWRGRRWTRRWGRGRNEAAPRGCPPSVFFFKRGMGPMITNLLPGSRYGEKGPGVSPGSLLGPRSPLRGTSGPGGRPGSARRPEHPLHRPGQDDL